jgi:hypothetical protein
MSKSPTYDQPTSKSRTVPDLKLQELSEDICRRGKLRLTRSDRDGLQHEFAADPSFVALAIVANSLLPRGASHMPTKPRVAFIPVMDATLQNIWITHGGYKWSLAEGIRQTVRRGQTNPV